MLTHRFPRSRCVAAAIAVALLVAACGGDDGATVRELGDDEGSASASGSGSGSASGSASAPASGSEGSAASDGGYDYASDVSAHRLVVLDVCDVNELLDAEPVDFDAVETIYVDGEHSVNSDGSVRTLAGFATAEDREHGFDEYYGTPAPLDDFVTDALGGSGLFEGADAAVRRQGVQKGIQNQIMIAWVIHELRAALGKAEEGEFDSAEGAPHNWDEAWAFYHGSEPGCAPFATADKRAENFGTTTADGETALANESILVAMNQGRDALVDEDVEAAQDAADEVIRNIVITYSQAIIRYATIVGDDVAADDAAAAREHQAEGFAFFRVIEPLLAEAGADVEVINQILALDSEPGANGGGDDVREALRPAFESLGISDDDIGDLITD